MNYLYLNNLPPQPTPRSFVFGKRNEKIDWRRIAAVDIERIARELDFQALQDNIEQIALCNIDMEVDSRAMDPNFIKLYKLAQLIIEYLLLCQDQITSQLVDYEQIKGKSFVDHEEFRRQIEKLKNDLNETKKESKKRKKLIETQQKMLMAQHSTHHTCPVCTHAFLSLDYLQAHMSRRHPEYDSNRKREHDVDIEKENQRLKNDLQNKETELQNIKVQKAVDEERLRERDENIRQLKDENKALSSKITILEEKYFTLRSSNQNRSPSPHQREDGVKELLKENKSLRAENEHLKQSLQQAENNLKREEKSKRRLERENQNLQKQIDSLNASGNTNRSSEELIELRKRYNEEKTRRKTLQDELDEANKQLLLYRNQPPPVVDRKSPAPTPRTSTSPPPTVTHHPRPTETIEIFLPQYCPSLIQRVNENSRYLNTFRTNAKNQFIDELDQYDNLGITEKDTRLSNNDFQTKMNIVEQTRQNMQDDLPNFERIRAELSRTLDKLAHERIHGKDSSGTPARSSGSKLVTFKDESDRQPYVGPTKTPLSAITTVQSKSKYASDEESSYTDNTDNKPSRGITNDIQPSPRKNLPSSGVNALAAGNMRPSISNNTNTISAIVRPKTTIKKYESESESEDSPLPTNVATKAKNLDQKLTEISSKGQKPATNAVAQGFQPTHKTVTSHKNDDDDDESDSSLTTINDTQPVKRNSLQPYEPPTIGGHTNPHLSSGDVSQYTYDSLFKSPTRKGSEIRRPATADSAKTSALDSDEELDEVSN